MKNLNRFLSLKVLVLFMASMVFFSSCKKDDDDNTQPSTPASYEGVFIINEGGFNKGNGAVDFYNPTDKSLSKEVFTTKNSRPLGDIFQSMTKVGDKFYLVVNNSSKIEVVNASDFKSVATINNLGSPRFMLSPSSSNGKKAYVTDLFNNQIYIVDLATNTKTGSINLKGWSEQMVEANGDVYVSNPGNKKVFVIDPTADAIKDSVELPSAPAGIVVDANKKLWVLVDTSGGQSAKLLRISPTTNSIEATVDFKDWAYYSKLAINGKGDKLYFTNTSGVYEMDITATIVPATPKKTGGFYGLGVDPTEGSIYVSDALDFNQAGVVTRVQPDGAESTFKSGIVPGGFYFNK